jgi:hypothetical protein
MTFFWVLMPCRLLGTYKRFRETYCLQLQVWRVSSTIQTIQHPHHRENLKSHTVKSLHINKYAHPNKWQECCAMAQVVSHWPLTTEAQIHTWVSSCGICGGRSDKGMGFSPSSSVFPCQYHSTHHGSTLIYHLGDEQQTRWWPQFRDIVSLLRHKQQVTVKKNI